MNQVKTIRLPMHIAKELNTYLRAQRELGQKLDHEPGATDSGAGAKRAEGNAAGRRFSI
jgi:RNA polymerase nonessential primary-like sigma factor